MCNTPPDLPTLVAYMRTVTHCRHSERGEMNQSSRCADHFRRLDSGHLLVGRGGRRAGTTPPCMQVTYAFHTSMRSRQERHALRPYRYGTEGAVGEARKTGVGFTGGLSSTLGPE